MRDKLNEVEKVNLQKEKFKAEDSSTGELIIATEPRKILINTIGDADHSLIDHFPRRMILVPNRRYASDAEEAKSGVQKSLVFFGDTSEEKNHLVKESIEFFDVNINRSNYRIYVDRKHEKVWIREFILNKHNGKEEILFKNAAVHYETNEILKEALKQASTPKNLVKSTLAYFYKNEIKRIDGENNKSKLKKGKVGRSSEKYLRLAVKWVINNHDAQLKSKTPTIRKAYVIYGKNSQSEEAFIKSVRTKWRSLLKEYQDLVKKEEKEQEQKITTSFKNWANNRLNKAATIDNKRLKRTPEGKN